MALTTKDSLLPFYPRAHLAMGNGDLLQVTNFQIKIVAPVKVRHTIRQQGAGITWGPQEASGSFDVIVSEAGEERDYIDAILDKRIRLLRCKLPGPGPKTLTIEIGVSEVELGQRSDDALEERIAWVGRSFWKDL